MEEPKKDNSKVVLIVLVVFLSLLVVCMGLYIAYEKGALNFITSIVKSDDKDSDPTDETVVEDVDIEETENVYNGETVSTVLPTGWSMVEYYDGNGSDMLTEGVTYTGLTGFKIFNAESEEVFSLEGVYGIGFAGCVDYYAFEDDSPSARDQAEADADEMGDTLVVHDLSASDYVEFEWLGTTVRRIDDVLYLDQEEGNNYFETFCARQLVNLEGLYFEDGSGYIAQAYFYDYADGVTDAELLQIDTILSGMTLAE